MHGLPLSIPTCLPSGVYKQALVASETWWKSGMVCRAYRKFCINAVGFCLCQLTWAIWLISHPDFAFPSWLNIQFWVSRLHIEDSFLSDRSGMVCQVFEKGLDEGQSFGIPGYHSLYPLVLILGTRIQKPFFWGSEPEESSIYLLVPLAPKSEPRLFLSTLALNLYFFWVGVILSRPFMQTWSWCLG